MRYLGRLATGLWLSVGLVTMVAIGLEDYDLLSRISYCLYETRYIMGALLLLAIYELAYISLQ